MIMEIDKIIQKKVEVMTMEEKIMEKVKTTKRENQMKENGIRRLEHCMGNTFCFFFFVHEDVALVGESLKIVRQSAEVWFCGELRILLDLLRLPVKA